MALGAPSAASVDANTFLELQQKAHEMEMQRKNDQLEIDKKRRQQELADKEKELELMAREIELQQQKKVLSSTTPSPAPTPAVSLCILMRCAVHLKLTSGMILQAADAGGEGTAPKVMSLCIVLCSCWCFSEPHHYIPLQGTPVQATPVQDTTVQGTPSGSAVKGGRRKVSVSSCSVLCFGPLLPHT